MSEKVKLPREVAEAIEHIRAAELTDFYIIGEAYKGTSHNPHVFTIVKYIRSNTGAWDEEHEKGYTHIMKALVNGYEVESSPEERIKAAYERAISVAMKANSNISNSNNVGFSDGIKFAINELGIKIEGVNA